MSPDQIPAPARLRPIPPISTALAVALAAVAGLAAADAADTTGGTARSGKEIYRSSCVSCHGPDGRGASGIHLGFEAELPDFTDCDFTSREPLTDWVAVAHEGGPARAFARTMPPFGDILTHEELALVVAYVKSFCVDSQWPPGELNLPRPLVTEKAHPEDEWVLTVTGTTEELDEIEGEIVFEERFGARNQWEIVVPYAWKELEDPADPEGDTSWGSGVGDVALAVKRDFYHSLERGSIFSLTAEVILPAGDEDEEFGKGTTVFEPFATWGQLLSEAMFVQFQGGVELTADDEKAENEAYLRMALGGTVSTGGGFGRAWSPMVEILGARELVSGAENEWDVLPQMQVTLSRRQHIRVNLGVRTPLTQRDDRVTSVIAYILWDWFDGGFFEGWSADDEAPAH